MMAVKTGVYWKYNKTINKYVSFPLPGESCCFYTSTPAAGVAS